MSGFLAGLLAEEKGQYIQIEGDASLLVSADRMILQRGVANIVENAIKYSPPSTMIYIDPCPQLAPKIAGHLL